MAKRTGPAKRRNVLALSMLLCCGGCSSAGRARLAPRAWTNASGQAATQTEVDACAALSGMTPKASDPLTVKLFDGCMRDHGFTLRWW